MRSYDLDLYNRMEDCRMNYPGGVPEVEKRANVARLVKEAKEVPEELRDANFNLLLNALENLAEGVVGCAKRE
jgi:hypothetical protein